MIPIRAIAIRAPSREGCIPLMTTGTHSKVNLVFAFIQKMRILLNSLDRFDYEF